MLHFELSSVARRRDSESFDRYVAEAGRAVKAIADSPPGYLTTLDKGLWDIVVDTLARVAPPSKIVLLGIGGSALGARTLADALCPAKRDHLLVLDNIDPHTISQALSNEELATALFLAISKSGSTAETASQLLYFRQRMIAAGIDDWAQRVIAITDPERGPLRELADREGMLTLPIPPDVGGRFSVLTPVGLAPAQLLGLDGASLIDGARDIRDAVFADPTGRVATTLAEFVAAHTALSLDGGMAIQVVLSYCDRLGTFGDWFCQLWAESLGKKHSRAGRVVHRGSTPLSAVGATDQHSLVQLFREGPDDKQYWVLSTDSTEDPAAIETTAGEVHSDFAYLGGTSLEALFRAERQGTVAALRAAGRPVSEISVDELDEWHLGALFCWFEMATSVTGVLYDVDPYDQPGVEAGKMAAFALMGRDGYADRAREILEDADADEIARTTLP